MTPHQLEQYRQDGFVILEGLFPVTDCDALVARMTDIVDGRATLPGLNREVSQQSRRIFNPHVHDALSLHWLLHPRLLGPLRECLQDEPEGIQTMYFWKGSEQGRHQDAFYLPGCVAAWIALQDVSADNGTIWVQPGSHRGHLITAAERKVKNPQEPGAWVGYNEAVDALFADNQLPEVPVAVSKGDVVIFDGKLIHRGGPIGVPDSTRHVLANHYLARGFDAWPFHDWPRYAFNGSQRLTQAPGSVAGWKQF